MHAKLKINASYVVPFHASKYTNLSYYKYHHLDPRSFKLIIPEIT